MTNGLSLIAEPSGSEDHCGHSVFGDPELFAFNLSKKEESRQCVLVGLLSSLG